jgi:tellurite resistance protein TerC
LCESARRFGAFAQAEASSADAEAPRSVMPEISEPTLWVGFLVFLLTVLGLDLFVFHRKTRVVSFKEAVFWVTVWASFAAFFGVLLYFLPNFGPESARQFFTGYVLEQALSVDNLFVFVLIFGKGFSVKAEHQHRVLFWGVLGAIVLRGAFILLGAAIVARFTWVLYVFGVFLLYTGGKLFFGGDDDDDESDIEDNRVVKLVRRFVPITKAYVEDKFFVKQGGRWMATPLFLVLVVVEVSDLIFAVDSIPTIFGVTTNGLIVFTSNMFAILGLRNIFIILDKLLPLFRFLERAVSLILVFIGAKLLIRPWFHVPDEWALGVVFGLLIGSVILSKLVPEKKKPNDDDDDRGDDAKLSAKPPAADQSAAAKEA